MASQAEVDLIVNATGALARLEGDLRNIVRTAQAGAPDIDLNAVLGVAETVRDIDRQLRQAIGIAQASAPDIHIHVDIDDASLRQADDSTRHFTSTILGVLGPLGSFTGSLGSAGLAAGALPGLLAGIATSVESIAPAAAVGVSALLTLKLATGALKIGMMGVSDAIKDAFDPETKPEDLAKELDRLAPSARAFVLELAGMKSEFRALQIKVQQELFRGLDDSVQALAKNGLPAVRRGLTDAAKTLNDMGQGAAKAATELADNGMLGQALRSSNKSLRSLVDIPGQAVSAFGALAVAAGPSLERIATAVAGVADRASKSLSKAFVSGDLEDAIDAAVDVIVQLGRVAKNVFGTLSNIMNAASSDGSGLFDTLETITGALKDATGTKEFQAAIGALSDTFGEIAKVAAPLLIQAIKILGPVIEELAGPAQKLIDVLGEQFGRILTELGPVLLSLAGAVGDIVIALLPFVELAGDLIVAILPALVPLFQTLSDQAVLLAPLIKELAENFGDQLVPILESLTPILEEILPQFVKFAEEIIPVLLETLEELSPSLADLAQSFADLLVAAAPLLAKFIEFEAFLLEKLLPILAPIAAEIMDKLVWALGQLNDFIREYAIPTLKLISQLLEGDFSGAMETASGIAASTLTDMQGAWQFFKDKVSGIIADFAVYVVAAGRSLIDDFQAAIGRGIGRAIEWFFGLPGRIRSALPSASSILYSAGGDIISGLIAGINSMIPSLISKLASITSSLPDWKGPEDLDKRILIPAGRAVMSGFTKGISDSVPALRAELAGITSSLPGLLTAPVSADFGFRGLIAAAPPLVTVNIGNQVLDQYVTTRIDTINRGNDRVEAQGTRF